MHVFSMSATPRPLQSYDTFSTFANFAARNIDEQVVLIFPSVQKGHVTVVRGSTGGGKIFSAHDGAIAALALSPNGNYYATASDKGTLIRIFKVATGQLLYELRRGTDRAQIWSICFSSDSNRVGVTSDKGTLHIFTLPDSSQSFDNFDRNSPISAVPLVNRRINEYLSSLRSLAQYSVGEGRSQVAFGPDPTIVYGNYQQQYPILQFLGSHHGRWGVSSSPLRSHKGWRVFS